MLFIGRGQDFALIDIIYLQCFQDLGFHNMADPYLGHDRDGYRTLYGLDNGGGRSCVATPPGARISAGTRSRAMTATAPASSAIRAWSAVSHIHDDASLEHAGKTPVHQNPFSRFRS